MCKNLIYLLYQKIVLYRRKMSFNENSIISETINISSDLSISETINISSDSSISETINISSDSSISENSGPANLSENKRRMIIRCYPKSPIRDSELQFQLQSTPCKIPDEKYPVFQKNYPENDDEQPCFMDNTADLIGSTRSLIQLFNSSNEEDSMHNSELKKKFEFENVTDESNGTEPKNDEIVVVENVENINCFFLCVFIGYVAVSSGFAMYKMFFNF